VLAKVVRPSNSSIILLYICHHSCISIVGLIRVYEGRLGSTGNIWQWIIAYLDYYLFSMSVRREPIICVCVCKIVLFYPCLSSLLRFLLVLLPSLSINSFDCSSTKEKKDKTSCWLTHDDCRADPEATAARSIIFSYFYP
jgi:hypothetical protein